MRTAHDINHSMLQFGERRDQRAESDVQRLRTAVGRHFYQTLYNDLEPEVFQRQSRVEKWLAPKLAIGGGRIW